MKPIAQVAGECGLDEHEVEPYGHFKAKVGLEALEARVGKPDGTLVLVTAMTPTKFGEGKTTVAIGLAQALCRLGRKAIVCLREPSLGPCLGMKGGGTGGGKATVEPASDINLHFNGDIHAVGVANNALAAMLDNHLHFGNELGLDLHKITLARSVDMNDRALRQIVIGLGGKQGGVPRESRFEITVASEVMAVLCLARSYQDLQARLARICVGFTKDDKPVYAADLKATGVMAALLREALKPNLVQTGEGTPAIVHGGPFANIAHGCSSILGTQLALKLAEFVVTEAGFGADLGGEKFVDIKCQEGDLTPSAAVIVATLRALKCHGSVPVGKALEPNREAVSRGLPNLLKHVNNMRLFGLRVVVALNHFPQDSPEEVRQVLDVLREQGVSVAVTDVHANGGAGGEELAELLVQAVAEASQASPLYQPHQPVADKLVRISTQIYGAERVDFLGPAQEMLERLDKLNMNSQRVCVAKTQYSLSDNPRLLGVPRGFTLTVRELKLASGAGFVVAYTGDIQTMPGLPRKPAAEGISLAPDGVIRGV